MENAKLGENARRAIMDPDNQVDVSAVSVLEIAIKRRIGKLPFPGSPRVAIGRNGFLNSRFPRWRPNLLETWIGYIGIRLTGC